MDNVTAVEHVSVGGFRDLMSGFPSGVVVVTTVAADGDPLGFTCSALCGVSLQPPLLLVCVANGSRTLAALLDHGTFAVNLLHCNGKRAARAFAAGGDDRFGTVPWTPSEWAGLPRLHDDAHTIAECGVRTTVVAGDHTIVVGDVRSVEQLTADAPLLYGLRQYRTWPGIDNADAMKGTG